MVVTVRYGDDPEPETFLLGVRDRADSDGIPVCSPDSPLGRALIGAAQGEEPHLHGAQRADPGGRPDARRAVRIGVRAGCPEAWRGRRCRRPRHGAPRDGWVQDTSPEKCSGA
ncbi:GreA/GreB family elongation factor [Nocardiopsis terrae]